MNCPRCGQPINKPRIRRGIRRIQLKLIGEEYCTLGDEEPLLCEDGVRFYFDLPNQAERIDLLLSSRYVRGAQHIQVIHGSGFTMDLDGTEVNVHQEYTEIIEEMGGEAWAWIEY